MRGSITAGVISILFGRNFKFKKYLFTSVVIKSEPFKYANNNLPNIEQIICLLSRRHWQISTVKILSSLNLFAHIKTAQTYARFSNIINIAVKHTYRSTWIGSA